MGKNSDIQSLIRLLVNVVVHKIVAEHTTRPESAHFLHSEFIEYRSQIEKFAKGHNWNNQDKEYAEKKAIDKIKEKLVVKYSDVTYSEHDIITLLKKMIEELM